MPRRVRVPIPKMALLILAHLCFFQKIQATAFQPFRVAGKFSTNESSGKLYIFYPHDGKWIKDSSIINNGSFYFTGIIEHPVISRISYKGKTKELFLEGDVHILIKDKQLSDVEILGSENTMQFRKLDSMIHKIDTRWQVVMDTLSKVNRRSNAEFQELKGWALKPYFEEIREVYIDQLNQYPGTYVSAYILAFNLFEMNQGKMTVSELEKFYGEFSDSARNSLYGKMIKVDIGKRSMAGVGRMAGAFSLPDVNGKPLALKDFRGKYVLLDFWGSWCIPCRKGNPHLKELYEKYKAKGFDIVGIASDNNTQDAWRAAIIKDGLPWHHVLIGDLDEVYNITSYPTKILVDKNGTIIGRYSSDEAELDHQLAVIFKENR